MRAATCWTILLLAGTLAGCGAQAANAPSSQGAWTLPPIHVQLFHAAEIEVPSTRPAEGAIDEPALDDDFGLLEDELVEQMLIADPIEGWNRAMFEFNDALYFAIVKPFLEGYNKVIPLKVRIAIRHFFRNLGTPARVINCMLQGKWEAVETELFRFAVNTTVGCLGFWDAAAEIHGVLPVNEDLGQTLGVWGLGNGCYLVWPLLGPSTLRDSAGSFGDQFLDPVRYVAPWPVSLGAGAVRAINEGSFSLGTYEAIKAGALDPYVAIRQSYVQYRDSLIRQ